MQRKKAQTWITSGAMYSKVPTVVIWAVRFAPFCTRDSPKSLILTDPSAKRSTLAGLRSRWMIGCGAP